MPFERDLNLNLAEGTSLSHEVERLCAAIRMPGFSRSSVLFVGWDKNDVPVISTENSSLSEQARTSYNITKTVQFPYDRELGSLPIEVVEFVGSSRPFDRKDTELGLTQDILTYWVTRGAGESEQIQIQELDMLNSILSGQVVWEDFNEASMQAQDKIPGQYMYTLFFPAQNDKKQTVMYLMTFRPPMKNESNVSMYRQFIIQTLTTLARIDADQPSDHRKGYLQAIGHTEGDGKSEVEGGLLAVGALDILRNKLPGFFNLSDERLEQIRRDSAGTGIVTQSKIILRELGLYNLPSKPHTPADLNSYSVEALLAVVGTAYELSSRAIRGNRSSRY